MAEVTLIEEPVLAGRISCSYDTMSPTVWTLQEPYARATSIGVVTVPGGFVWDGASVPRILWNIIPAWGTWSGAALIHDKLYRNHDCSREIADAIFWVLMTQDGVANWRAGLMWCAVRLFGWRSWEKHA
jgi:hypothetical protein